MELYKTQALKIYNSLSSKKEIFKPIVPGYIGMYVCGPTVYNKIHLGNCRTFVSFDLIFRYLKHLGYKVRYVRNITDAGHLENDADYGEDRIAKKARLEEIEPMEVVQKYTVDFHETLAKFNNLPPSIEPTATGHIIEQIGIIQNLIDKEFAYEVNGSVYFDVKKYNEQNHYGILSGRKLEDMITNTRDLAGQADKRGPHDFALWKKAEPQHIMRWPSPWSLGFPGWHLECTAMSTKYLGEEFDIHGGGMDLKFPHHECEIAQGKATTGKNPVHYWMHANMLTLNGAKMAKSTGNNILPSELFSGNSPLLSKGYSPNVVRFFMLQANYRSILDFSEEALNASEKGFEKLITAIENIEDLPVSANSTFNVQKWQEQNYATMNDDFNSPMLIANLFEAAKQINAIKLGKEKITETDKKQLKEIIQAFAFEVLGLEKTSQANNSTNKQLDEVLKLLLTLRDEARANKEFELADTIRKSLTAIGIELKDNKDGTSFSI